jgi:hypothetical protein
MLAIRIVASVILLAGGLWAAFRPWSRIERQANERPPQNSIVILRMGILAATAFCIALVWL